MKCALTIHSHYNKSSVSETQSVWNPKMSPKPMSNKQFNEYSMDKGGFKVI